MPAYGAKTSGNAKTDNALFDIYRILNWLKIDIEKIRKIVVTGISPSTVNHALLHNLNSASYTHLTAVNATDLTDGGATTLHKHDHGNLDGLADDDHTQYHNNTRGDLRYPALVNPSVNDNLVAFNGVAGQQKDSGYKVTDLAIAGHDNFDEVFLLMGA